MSGPLEFLIVLAILGGVVVFVTAPLRRLDTPGPAPDATLPSSRPRARPSTASCATRSSITAPASCPTPTTRSSTGRLRGEAIEILRGIDRATIDEP